MASTHEDHEEHQGWYNKNYDKSIWDFVTFVSFVVENFCQAILQETNCHRL